MLQHILDSQPAFALGGAQISRRENPAEPAVGGAILRIGDEVRRPVVEGEPRAGHDAHARERRPVLARENMRAHDAGERVAVGDPDPGQLQLGRARDHLLRMRGPAQKRKIRHPRQLGEARLEADHPNTPCTNHFALCVSRPQRPSR